MVLSSHQAKGDISRFVFLLCAVGGDSQHPFAIGNRRTSTAFAPLFLSRTLAVKSFPISSGEGEIDTIVTSNEFSSAPASDELPDAASFAMEEPDCAHV